MLKDEILKLKDTIKHLLTQIPSKKLNREENQDKLQDVNLEVEDELLEAAD